MSRSPTRSLAKSVGHEDYKTAERQLYQLVKSGHSFSGHERHCAFLNLGSGRFANVSSITGFDFADDGRAMATTDWDQDGDLDVWLLNRTAPRARFLRNDLPAGQHYLAVRLEGRTCNRDAIGARVEVTLDTRLPQKLIRTVRAGEGYLSQSSRWLHFGLGQAERVEQLIVRWPDGSVEQYRDLIVDQHYQIVQGHIVQGAVQAQPREVARREGLAIAPSRTKVPSQSGRAATFLSSPVPVPQLPYQTDDGLQASLNRVGDDPLLVNLWASWCRPCEHELTELSSKHQVLRDAGLDVLALSVDSLSSRQQGTPPIEVPTTELLNRLGWPFRHGQATESLVDRLQAVHNFIFNSSRPLPVPCSFLLDTSGSLAAVYRGPVPIDQLLDDVEKLSLNGKSRLLAAMPFSGRWYTPPASTRLLPLVAELIDQGSWNTAVDFSERHSDQLSRDVGYAELLHRFGREFLNRDQARVAATYFQQAIDLEPKAPDGHYNLATALTELEQLDDAIASFEETLRLDPDHVRAHNNLANLLRATGNLTRASGHYRQALRLNPDLLEVRQNLANVLLSIGRYEEAHTHLEQLLDLQPDNAQAHNNMGVMLAEKQQWDQAIVHYRQALKCDEHYAQAHNNLATILAFKGKTAEAIEHLRQATGIDPEFADAFRNLGRLLHADHQSDEAVEKLRAAIQLKPDDAEAHGYLAIARLAQGNLASAIEHAREAVRLDPIDGGACVRLGELLSKHGQNAEAIDWFRQALELNPNDALAHNRLGLSLASAGETEEAIEHLRQAVSMNPDDLQGMTALAWLLATSRDVSPGQLDEALRLTQQAVKLTNGQRADVLQTLAVVHAAAGELAQAIDVQRRAIQVAQTSGATASRTASMRQRLQQFQSMLRDGKSVE